jgi:hypothetical protein
MLTYGHRGHVGFPQDAEFEAHGCRKRQGRRAPVRRKGRLVFKSLESPWDRLQCEI